MYLVLYILLASSIVNVISSAAFNFNNVHTQINALRQMHGSRALIPGGSIFGRASIFAKEYLSDFLKDSESDLSNSDSFLEHDDNFDETGATVHVLQGDFNEEEALFKTFEFIIQHQDYNYTNPTEDYNSEVTRAFTQMLWLNTKEIDYTVLQVEETNLNGKIETVSIVVFIYSPVGNVEGQFKENVKEYSNNDERKVLERNEKTQMQLMMYWISMKFTLFSIALNECAFLCHLQIFLSKIKTLVA